MTRPLIARRVYPPPFSYAGAPPPLELCEPVGLLDSARGNISDSRSRTPDRPLIGEAPHALFPIIHFFSLESIVDNGGRIVQLKMHDVLRSWKNLLSLEAVLIYNPVLCRR